MFSLPRELRADLKKAGMGEPRPRRGARKSLDVTPVSADSVVPAGDDCNSL